MTGTSSKLSYFNNNNNEKTLYGVMGEHTLKYIYVLYIRRDYSLFLFWNKLKKRSENPILWLKLNGHYFPLIAKCGFKIFLNKVTELLLIIDITLNKRLISKEI